MNITEVFSKKTGVQFLRFCLVGGSSTILQLSLLYLLTEVTRIHYLISSAIAFIISVAYSFCLHRVWTFEVNFGKISSQLSVFYTIYISTLIGNSIGLYILVEFFSVYYLLAQWIMILFFGIINFLLSKYITFATR